ncbi:hypothetical protein [Aestuariibius sp. HNIBRBA575]|uniref:DUF7103 family protein n=1 Tax=Aestuariibius sp. HNIBRBA575 TaxID=3233343 RepID=UPI0034A45EF7
MTETPRISEFERAIDRHAHAENTRHEVIRSYYRVRQTLGYLGVSLPFLLMLSSAVSNAELEPSLSDFFHTISRDVFVGVLFAIGTFLVIYEGYEREPGETFTDNWLATVAGLSVFGVALFPNESPSGQVAALTQQLVGIGISPIIHYSSCLIFFYCMGHFCLFRFSKTKHPGRRKYYIACGWTIVACGTMLAIASYWKQMGPPALTAFVLENNVVFWVEAIGVWAFSSAWVIKGRGDQELLAAFPINSTRPKHTQS